MSNDTPTPQERIAPDEYATSYAHVATSDGDWEAVGRRAVARLLADALADLQQETRFAIDDVRRGESVTTDHVEVLRECLDTVEYAVEAHLAALADDAEPWSVDGPAWVEGDRPRFARGTTRTRDLPPRYSGGDNPERVGRGAPSRGGVRGVESGD